MLVAARQSTSSTTFTSVQSLQVARCRGSSVGGVGGRRRRTLFWWLLLVVLAQPIIIVARGADDTKMLTTTGDHYQRDRDLSDEGDVDEVHDDAVDKQERHLSSQVRNVSLPVQQNYFLSRLRTADSAPQDWQIYCTDTAEVVHQLIKTWLRVYAEYQADVALTVDLLPVGRHSDRRDSTTLCLERKFHWTGSVHGTAHAQSDNSGKLPKVVRACPPEIEGLVHAINATHATYLAVEGSADSVFKAVKCIPLERIPVHVVSIERHDDDVTSVRAPRRTLSLQRASVDQQQWENEMTRRGWSFYAETTRDLVFVRPHDVIRRRH